MEAWHENDQSCRRCAIELLLSDLRLPAIKLMWAKLAEQSDKEGWAAARFLAALAEHEIADRCRRRIERHLAEARLPVGKTLASFDFEVVPMVSKAQVMALTSGDKSHLAATIGLALVEHGWRVLFMRTSDLVQRLQIARRELALENTLAKLDKYHLLILDDIAYVSKDQAETSVLFELRGILVAHWLRRIRRCGPLGLGRFTFRREGSSRTDPGRSRELREPRWPLKQRQHVVSGTRETLPPAHRALPENSSERWM